MTVGSSKRNKHNNYKENRKHTNTLPQMNVAWSAVHSDTVDTSIISMSKSCNPIERTFIKFHSENGKLLLVRGGRKIVDKVVINNRTSGWGGNTTAAAGWAIR